MPLTNSEVDRMTAWLQTRGVNATCPACAKKQWGLGEIISQPVANRLGSDMSAEHMPAVTLVCGNCGYIMFFSAKLVGLR
jgi:predicted nucleic-acid-binding Zn-ribbon protein